jgi:aspartate/methionine/tyrosine aminotransferase
MNEGQSLRYPIAAVRERVRRHEGTVLDFAVGRHREPTPESLLELVGRHRDGSLLTPCSQEEIDAYTKAAAGMIRRTYGVTVLPAAVLPVPGGRTAISFIASALIGPGDGVAVVEPAYPAFVRVAGQLHGRVHSVTLDPDRDLAPDHGSLSADDATAVRFAALNYPNNPTGAVITDDDLSALLGRFTPGTIVFNDATYGPLTYARPPWSLLAAAGDQARSYRLVELHSLAKLFSLGPLSVAFLVGDERIIAGLRELSEFAWSDQSSLQVRVALHCLEDGDQFEKVRAVFRARLARLHETLHALGFRPLAAASGMYLVCRTPTEVGGKPVSSASEAAEVLLADHGIAVVPWEIKPKGYLRFSAQYRAGDLEALAELGRRGPLASS